MDRREMLQVAKPILFNTEMVKAILDGRKTTTRRLVKPAKPFRNNDYHQGDGLWIDGYNKDDEPNGHVKDYSVSCCWITKKMYIERFAPYKIGDILYVRETWNWLPCYECGQDMEDGSCGTSESRYNHKKRECGCYQFRADYNDTETKWHPSIHMPKEAARIFLKVTGVRMERLQEISESDIYREGIVISADDCAGKFDFVSEMYFLFQNLWNSTIKKSEFENYGWEANPWVWVIEFEKLEVKL